MMRWILPFLIIASLMAGCSKKENFEPIELPDPDVNKIPVVMSVEYTFGTSPLVLDTMLYTSAAGLRMSVVDVKYYLSRIEVADENNKKHRLLDYVYGDTRKNNVFEGKLPAGLKAKSLHLIIGFNTEDNRHDYLESTMENFNMIWPTEMGGGYHFLKFEGRYLSSDGKSRGYAMHLGENGYEVYVEMPMDKQFTSENQTIKLRMDVHRWLFNPVTYDFEKDGNYSMGIAENMEKLKKNGNDVLSIISVE